MFAMLDRVRESLAMKWGVRLVLVLRRIAVACERIADELHFQNERAFPPLKETGPGKTHIVISKGKANATREDH